MSREHEFEIEYRNQPPGFHGVQTVIARPSDAVIEALTHVINLCAPDTPVLYETIDLDALDSLLRPALLQADNASVTVAFDLRTVMSWPTAAARSSSTPIQTSMTPVLDPVAWTPDLYRSIGSRVVSEQPLNRSTL